MFFDVPVSTIFCVIIYRYQRCSYKSWSCHYEKTVVKINLKKNQFINIDAGPGSEDIEAKKVRGTPWI